MTAKEFFSKKNENAFFEDDKKSVDYFDDITLNQFCYDMGVDDDEIEETVEALKEWRNKRAEIYHKYKMEQYITNENKTI